MRPSGRAADALRAVSLEPDINKHAEGSCLVRLGDTHVICTATVEQRVPHWLKGSGKGWITAEYGMLPRATGGRTNREATRGKQSGRTQEIQRLIGRALRTITDLTAINEIQIRLDCDVIQADGGSRTASITGAYVALHRALSKIRDMGIIETVPLKDKLAAVSCGIFEGEPILDLDYAEDSTASTDANFVLTGAGTIVEIQATAEAEPMSDDEFTALLGLARKGVAELIALQNKALGLE